MASGAHRISRSRSGGEAKKATGAAGRIREGLGVLVAAAGAYVLVSVVSYHPLDPSFNSSLPNTEVQNAGGIVGAYLSDVLVQLFGLSAYVGAGILFAIGARMIFGRAVGVRRDQTVASITALVSAAALLEVFAGVVAIGGRPAAAGGVLGRVAGGFAVHWINPTGVGLFAGALLVLATMVLTGGSVAVVLTKSGQLAKAALAAARDSVASYRAELRREAKVAEAAAPAPKLAKPSRKKLVEDESGDDDDEEDEKKAAKADAKSRGKKDAVESDDDEDDDGDDVKGAKGKKEEKPGLLDLLKPDAAKEVLQGDGPQIGPKIVAPMVYKPKTPAQKKKDLDIPPPEPGSYQLPDPALLVSADQKTEPIDANALKASAEVLEKKLKDFGVFGRVVEVHPGPVITMFEFEPAAGVKVNKVANLVDDLKLALKATSVRIVAPIPGKGTVGIEIPNENRETVYLKDILSHAEYTEKQTFTPLALGKDIAGRPVVADMAKMPHLLVAGTTGSGKSVSVNAMIMSMLYRATPNDLRLIMIDPKMLEFSIYDGIPHLLLPVITNPKKASMALKWAVTEMERRYRLLADVNARNITAYNKRIPKILEDRAKEAASQQPEHVNDPEDGAPSLAAAAEAKFKPLEHGHLPFIVIVIDELADLMLVAKNEVEESITRLAQMARAAGIHLLLATQRPSVDVITGVIKANFPARIAFRVFSKIDSRTVLDAGGAETLLGDGDMLFLPPMTGRLIRVHGAFISDTEIQKVVDFWKAQGKPRYEEEILRAATTESAEGGAGGDEEHDEFYDQAVAIVAETRQASISFIQRKLKVGYNRAARMIERMEQEGIVGASDGVRPRPVLIQQLPPG